MDPSWFDAWTRRRFGLAGGALAALFGLGALDETEAGNNKGKKRRNQRRERQRNQHRKLPCSGPGCARTSS